ncbi:MAG: four helix bundle protein [Anaerohalosphaeraceae bacterium]|nr:four helix bundle protein [Anaerohalosphaeraceae bacterium]
MIKFLDSIARDNATDVIIKQLLRSSTSVGANIVEAKGASSKRDFAKFYSYSLKSANESLYWLGLLRDAKDIKNKTMNYLINETRELSKILGASILTMKGKSKF